MIGAGFDPSIASPGLAVVRREPKRYAFVRAHTVRTDASDPLELRLNRIADELSLLLRETMPSFLAIEDQTGVQYGKRRAGGEGVEVHAGSSKTIMVVGVAFAVARLFRVPAFRVQPVRVKLSVLGKGNASASKAQVQAAIERLTGARLAQDAADAMAIAIAGCQMVAARRGGRERAA